MSNIVLDAISRLTGNDYLSRCIKLCGFEDFSELINIDEKTLDQMEIFLQKKCSRMSLSERRIFLGDNFAENPDLFKFSPGNRQKFLNVLENLSKIFTTSNLPFSMVNLKEICQQYEANNRSALTAIPRNALKMVLSNERLPTDFINNNPMKSVAIINQPQMIDITQKKVTKKSFEPYPNIFQRMDLLRKGEMGNNKNIEEKEKSMSFEKNYENSITNKENKEQTRKSVKVKKRKADDDPDYQEPVKKKLHEYRKYTKKSKFWKKVKLSKRSAVSDSSDSNHSHSTPIRSRSQRLMDKNKIGLEPKNIEEPVPRVKRKYTKRVKTIPISENTETNELTKEQFNHKETIEDEKMENLASHGIYKVAKPVNEIPSVKSNPLNVKQSMSGDVLLNSDVKSINIKNSAENILKLTTNNNTTSYLKILPNSNQNAGVRFIGSLNKNEHLYTKSLYFQKNIERFPAPSKNSIQSNPNLSIESHNTDKSNENLLKTPLNPTENRIRPISSVQNMIIQPKIINSNQLKVNIVSSSGTNLLNQPAKPVAVNVNISKVSLSNNDQSNPVIQSVAPQPIRPKLKLSDVPFKCFEINTIKKAPVKSRQINALTKISVNPSVQPKNMNIDSKSKMQSSIINRNRMKVIQIPKIPAVVNQIIEPSKENFTDQINPIKSTSSSNFRFEPVKILEKSILSSKTPTTIDSEALEITAEKIGNSEEVMDISANFSMKPQWTSTPIIFTNRFINGNKHKKSIPESGKTMENKSQSEGNKSFDIIDKYRY